MNNFKSSTNKIPISSTTRPVPRPPQPSPMAADSSTIPPCLLPHNHSKWDPNRVWVQASELQGQQPKLFAIAQVGWFSNSLFATSLVLEIHSSLKKHAKISKKFENFKQINHFIFNFWINIFGTFLEASNTHDSSMNSRRQLALEGWWCSSIFNIFSFVLLF